MIKKLISIILIVIIITLSLNTSNALADNRFFTTEGGGGGGDAIGFTLGGTLSVLLSIVTGNRKSKLEFTNSEINQIQVDLFVTNDPAGLTLAKKLSKLFVRKDNINVTLEMDKNEGIIHSLDNYMIKVNTKLKVSPSELNYLENKIISIKGLYTNNSLYQKWEQFPEFPSDALLSIYPYQAILKRPIDNKIFVYYSSVKIAKSIDNIYLDGYIRGYSTTEFFYGAANRIIGSSGIHSSTIVLETNYDIYTDLTYTTVLIPKTTIDNISDGVIIPGTVIDGKEIGYSQRLINIDNIAEDISFKITQEVIDEFETKTINNVNTDDIINTLEKSEARAKIKGESVVQNISLDQVNIKEYEESLVALQQMQDGIQNNFNTTWDNFDLSFNPPEYILNGMSFVSYVFTQIWYGFGDYIIIITFSLTIGAVILLITGAVKRKKEDE